MKSLSLTLSLSCFALTTLQAEQPLTPSSVPTFVLNFDEHPSTRYNEIFTHFKDGIIEMENHFMHSVAPQYREIFKRREDHFLQMNPEAFYAMESLSKITGLPIWQTLLVNSIVDFSSFCTSIVARMQNGTIIHARNLDFDFPDLMETLVYKAYIKKNGKIVGEAPAIAGYIGFYTGIRYNNFTVSYNVRILRTNMSDIIANIDREFKKGYVPTAQLIQRALLDSQNYDEAVNLLSNHLINTPCYIIVGGTKDNEGIVIVRDPQGLNRTNSLNATQWYVAQTNLDHWNKVDPRYNATVNNLNLLGQQNANGLNLVQDVLHKQGVLQSITIFSASMSASIGNMDIYLVDRQKRSNFYLGQFMI